MKKGSKYLKRGPRQGVLYFMKILKKIHKNLKYGLEPPILDWASSVIPFRKAIDSTVTGMPCDWKSEPWPMRNEHFKKEKFDTITFDPRNIWKKIFKCNLYWPFLERCQKKIGQMGVGSRFFGKKIKKKGSKSKLCKSKMCFKWPNKPYVATKMCIFWKKNNLVTSEANITQFDS